MPKPNISENRGPQPKVFLYEKSTKEPEFNVSHDLPTGF